MSARPKQRPATAWLADWIEYRTRPGAAPGSGNLAAVELQAGRPARVQLVHLPRDVGKPIFDVVRSEWVHVTVHPDGRIVLDDGSVVRA